MNRRILNEGSMLALALVGAVSLARLSTGGVTLRDTVVTAVAGMFAVATSRSRLSVPSSLLIALAMVIVMALWLSLSPFTWHGFPTVTTLRAAIRVLRAVGGVHHLPVRSSAGVVLVCSLLAGVTAAVTRAGSGAMRLVPVLLLVTISIYLVPSTASAWLGVAFAVAATATLATSWTERPGWLVGSLATVTAAACVLVVGASNASAVSPGGPPIAAVPPSALSLVSNLTGLETRDPDLVMFSATTPYPTYWQVASLAVLEGNTWVPDAATAAALAGTSGTPAATPTVSGSRFTAKVTIANLSSRLLPVPPSPVAVTGATLTSVGALATRPTTPGQSYQVRATVPQAGGESANPGEQPEAAEFTALPPISPTITTLARLITASASTPLAQAEAITNWLRSGRFHYSLRSATTSLDSFLTVTRTGSCEQFAGAFAVLARSVGLPTRVAIGFSTGLRDISGTTVVRGLDAHAWPEVLLGGSWISFEPTPQLPSGELTPPGVIGITAQGTANPTGLATIPSSIPPFLIHPPTTANARVSHGLRWWPEALGGGLALLAGLVGLFLWRRRSRLTPADRLVAAWDRVDRALRRGGRGRPPWRTPTAYVKVVRTVSDARGLDDLEWLATLLEETTYGSAAVEPQDVRRAMDVSRRLAKSPTLTR